MNLKYALQEGFLLVVKGAPSQSGKVPIDILCHSAEFGFNLERTEDDKIYLKGDEKVKGRMEFSRQIAESYAISFELFVEATEIKSK